MHACMALVKSLGKISINLTSPIDSCLASRSCPCLSFSILREYPKCLVCDVTPNPKRVSALIAEATTYDNTTFDAKDLVIVSETEVYCCTECYVRAVVTQEDALDEIWNRTVFYR